MFENLIVQPIFNLLVLIYAIIPGHNFGLAMILFTILIRLVMHPLIKKQLHHGKAMRELKPEIDRIKAATKGDPQETSKLINELYKEREISPFSSMGVIAVQVVVLIGLYSAIRHVAGDPGAIVNNSYEWLKNLGILKELAADISRFDFTLFGVVDLSRAVSGSGGFYFPALLLVSGATVAQYFMGKQTLPEDKEARSLRAILKGPKRTDKSLARELASESVKYLIPLLIFVFTYGLPSALALYWMIGGIVGYLQQKKILKQDETELLRTTPGKKPKAGS